MIKRSPVCWSLYWCVTNLGKSFSHLHASQVTIVMLSTHLYLADVAWLRGRWIDNHRINRSLWLQKQTGDANFFRPCIWSGANYNRSPSFAVIQIRPDLLEGFSDTDRWIWFTMQVTSFGRRPSSSNGSVGLLGRWVGNSWEQRQKQSSGHASTATFHRPWRFTPYVRTYARWIATPPSWSLAMAVYCRTWINRTSRPGMLRIQP